MGIQTDSPTTDAFLDGFPRVHTFITIDTSDFLSTISVTRPLIINNVEVPTTYVKTLTYGTGGGIDNNNVTNVSEWVKQ